MATFLNRVRCYTWSGAAVYGTLTGNVSRSGNTVTLSGMTLTLDSDVSVWGTDTLTFTVQGSSTSFGVSASGTSLGSHALNNASKTVGGGDTSTSFSWSTSDGFTGSFNVSFPSGAPSGLALSNIVPGTDNFKATVSVTAWNSGSSSTRRRELSVCTAQSAAQRKKTVIYGDTLSSAITVDNTATLTDGAAFTITPNTRYYLTTWASNGTAGTGNSNFTQAVTLAEKPTITIESTTADSATLGYSTTADGGFYDKIIEWSEDDGSTWNTAATITGGSAEQGTFTITGLTTGEHTVLVRVRTTSGSAGNVVVSLNLAAVRLISSDGTTGRESTRMLVPVDGVATEASRLLVSHNGVATENA